MKGKKLTHIVISQYLRRVRKTCELKSIWEMKI